MSVAKVVGKTLRLIKAGAGGAPPKTAASPATKKMAIKPKKSPGQSKLNKVATKIGGGKTKSTMSKVPTKPGKGKTTSTMSKVPKNGASKALHNAKTKGIKQKIQTHTQKTAFHQKRAERLKSAGAHEASHPQHAQYKAHMAHAEKHTAGAAKQNRKLAAHIKTGTSGKKGKATKQLSQATLSTISRMRY